ncbi:MAG: hypothetical protein CMJ81_19010 [Planctomycetaceae bacterium]|nr:hypothetical protein [Planctomycetaceae bacterium]MBP62670.1 hypothetical protein [Planctomycetaceae bacterium]
MVFAHIEKLKQEYTDKYVTVDEQLPELRRFGHMTGIVKTVNMNGRALVEFDGSANIGWYDIEIDFLKVVDKPVVDETTKKKPAAKAPSELEKARAADSKTTDGKTSVEDILAAARGEKGGAKASSSNSPTEDADDVAAVLEAARKPKSGSAAVSTPTPKADLKSISVADVLAAARGNQAATPASGEDAALEEPDSPEESADEGISESEQEPATAVEEEVVEGAAVGELPTDIEGIVTYCRQCDGS